ncbi:Ribonuclease H domain [Sesbania bispinosa]|nr:Ribonuclease H domain [Sesbania bispinosa]
MEDQRRERVTPRRLSFNLDDFSGTPDAERNQGSNKTHEVQPELNLLQNLETPANADGTGVEDTPIVVTTSMLNSILAGQQSLVEMVADLSSLVSSKRSNEEAVRMRNTREAADDALVTQRDLKQLLQNKLSPPNTIFDLEPPLSEAVMMIPYPQGYQPPTFRKFDGTGSAREHIMSFLDDLGVYRSSKSLRLEEFSKSLAGRAFTWYAKLKPHSIETWESLVTEFCGKFLEEEGAIHIMDLGRIKQKAGEGLITFIKRYRDRTLQCKETLPEADLVYGCIKNIEDGSQIFLGLSGGKKVKGTEDMFDVCMNEEREKRRAFKSGRSPRKTPPYNNNEVPPIPLNRHQICQLVEEWLKDGTLRHDKVEEIEEERYDEEKLVATGLAKTRGFRMLFGQLGMGEDAQREAAKAIIHIARKWGGHLGAVNAPLTKLAQSHATTIIFREPANLNPQLCHNRPLYVEAIIEGIKIRRALVDNGVRSKHHPPYLFHKLNMPSGRPWIHLHQCVPSTLHQCIKSNFRGKEIEIPGVKAPFEATESHLIDATLFDDVAPPGSSQLRTEQGILLREVNGSGSTSSTSRPCQALKKPRPKERTEIKRSTFPMGSMKKRIPGNKRGYAGGEHMPRKGKRMLNFPCTNNEAEYEALILGLKMTLYMKVQRLRVWGDSNLVIKQLKGEYGVKEASLAVYRDEASRLMDLLEEVHMTHIPRAANKHADALATIGSKEGRETSEGIKMKAKKVGMSALCHVWTRRSQPLQKDAEGRRRLEATGLKEYLSYGVTPESPLDAEKLKKKAERYFNRRRGTVQGGPLRRHTEMPGKRRAAKVMAEVHGGVCGRHQGGRSLWAEILKNGYYWPTMREDTLEFARRCRACQLHGNLIHAPSSQHARCCITVSLPHMGIERVKKCLQHHRRLTLTYEKMVRPRMFQEGDLVLKATYAIMRKQHVSKWHPTGKDPTLCKKQRKVDIALS